MSKKKKLLKADAIDLIANGESVEEVMGMVYDQFEAVAKKRGGGQSKNKENKNAES